MLILIIIILMILISILILIMLLLINKDINNYNSITINNDHCSNNFVNNSYNK